MRLAGRLGGEREAEADARAAAGAEVGVEQLGDRLPLAALEEVLEDEDEEHQQSLREEIEHKYYPERHDFWPFGDPFINKRKREAIKRRQQGQRQWYDED